MKIKSVGNIKTIGKLANFIREQSSEPEQVVVMCQQCDENVAVPGKTTCANCTEQGALRSIRRKELCKMRGLCTSCGKRKCVGSYGLCQKCRNKIARRKERLMKKKLCIECGETPVLAGERMCQKCHDKSNASKTKYRLKIKAAKLCARCAEVPVESGSYCAACKKYRRDRTGEERAVLVKAGICTKCQKRYAREGLVTCKACSERDRAYRVARDTERRAAGQCAMCENTVDGAERLCKSCRAVNNINAAARYYMAKNDGICVICHKKPACSNKTACQECQEAHNTKYKASNKEVQEGPNE